MSFSYSLDPARSRMDKVRFLLNDTDPSKHFLEDEEILAMLGDLPNPLLAAAACADNIAAILGQRPSQKQVGDLQIQFPFRGADQSTFVALAKQLRRQYNERAPHAWAGGTSQADKNTRTTDPDAVQPAFRRGMQEDPATRWPSTRNS